MRARKLETTETKSRSPGQTAERQGAVPGSQSALTPQHEPLPPSINRIGKTASGVAHASSLSRVKASQPSRTQRSILHLQQQYGNRYVQQQLALDRQGAGGTTVTPEVERSIQRARGGGQALDSGVRSQMEPAFGADLSGVQVHTGAEADTLNRALNARAFTTGQDIFFRQGAYNPGSSSGRELMAHELTHVVQQTGAKAQPKLVVNAPGDKFEQEADRVARAVMNHEQKSTPKQAHTAQVGRQAEEEKEEPARAKPVQRQAEEEEDTTAQAQLLQRQAEEEKEEPAQAKLVQRQAEEEEDTTAQAQPLQRQAEEEKEEPAQAKPVQRQAEEEEDTTAQAQLLQRQAEEEKEEPAQAKLVQRQAEEDEDTTAQAQILQRQAEEEKEEPAQAKPVQRQAEEDEDTTAQAQILQRQAEEEKEEPAQARLVQRQAEEDEDTTAQAQPLQRQAEEEKEEPVQAQLVQRQADEEEDTAAQAQPLQRQAEEEKEEPVQAQLVQRQADEEEDTAAQTQPLQRQAEEEREEPVQTRLVQRQAEEDKEEPVQARRLQRQPDSDKLEGTGGPETHTPRSALKAGAAPPGSITRFSALTDSHIQRQNRGVSGAGAESATKPPRSTAPVEVDLKGKTNYDELPDAVGAWLEGQGGNTGQVNVRFGTIAGPAPISIKKTRRGLKLKKTEAIPLRHPLFARIGEVSPELQPSLVLRRDKEIKGHIGLRGSRGGLPDAQALANRLGRMPSLIGLSGFSLRTPSIPNKLEGGTLQLGPAELPLRFGKVLSGKVTVEATDERVTKLEGSAKAQIQGLAAGELTLNRSEQGIVTGEGSLDLQLPKNFSGKITVLWTGETVSGTGKVGYQGEKLSGEVTLNVMEQSKARQLEQQRKAPSETGDASAAKPGAARKSKKVDRFSIFGEGDLTFAFTEWLAGSAHVIVDPKGHVTVIGKITPQKEVELFPQKDYSKDLFEVDARARYGLPVVGNIYIFAGASMDAFAKLGPAKLYKIMVEGTYSTDPKKSQDFSIQGTLNISAAAGLRLRGEAGAGLEILSHDIKAGAGVNAIAAIRGYAEATPIIGYREKAGAEGEDKKGEFFIRGDMEIAAQPFLGLSGDLFVEVDAPWWSPVPDKKWTWPLGDKEWPIGGTFGIGASVDYVFGSGQVPAVEFKSVDFSAEKFFTDLYSDKAKVKGETAAEKAGEWKERNTREAEPPKGEMKGDAKAAKPPPLPAAKPKVEPGGPKKAVKPAPDNAQTAEGKTVKEYKEETRKKGAKPDAKEPEKGTASEEAKGAEDTAKKAHDGQLKAGLAALDAITKRYTRNGATKEEVVTGVKSVRRKFKVFKSITVIDGGETWDYDWVASNPKKPRKGAKKASGQTKIPTKTVIHESPEGGKSKEVEANPLTRNAEKIGSKSTKAPVKGWEKAQALNVSKQLWVKAHLLHHRLGGPTQYWNLVPASSAANTRMYQNIESSAIGLLYGTPKDRVFWYKVSVEYHDAPNAEFAKEIKATYGYKVVTTGEEKAFAPPPIFSDPPPQKEGHIPVNLSTFGRDRLMSLGELDQFSADAIVRARQLGGPFQSMKDFEERAGGEGLPSGEIEDIKELIRKSFFVLH